MVPVTNATAAVVFQRDRYRYLAELLGLVADEPPVPRNAFADSDDDPRLVMYVEQYPWGPYVTVSAYDPEFARDCVGWWREQLGEFTLGSTDPRLFDDPALREAFALEPVRCYRSFVCTSLAAVPDVTGDARLLAEADRAMCARYPEESRPHCPNLSGYLDMMVGDGQGEVLILVEEGDVIAYLACDPSHEEIWDVAFIHVREDRRGHRLGTRIAAEYARRMLTNGRIPYYSGVTLEASARAALGAGFACCRELYSTTARPR